MRGKLTCLLLLLFTSLVNYAQEITYDTTYQVTYENGVKDSVIIIYKRVVITEKVYVVDSSERVRFGYDVFATPIFTGLSKGRSTYSSESIINQNQVTSHLGQSVGTHFYCSYKKWDFRSGISLSRHSLKVNSNQLSRHTLSYLTIVNDTLDVYYSVDDQQDTTYFYITEPKEITQQEVKESQQQREVNASLIYLNLPIQVGYRASYKSWNFNVYAGPVLSFLILTSGNVLDEQGEPTSSIRNNVEKVVFNFEGNIQVGYNINENIHLFGEPFIQKYIGTFNQQKTIYTSDIMGFRAGMKFSL